jgi:hypothetical protein
MMRRAFFPLFSSIFNDFFLGKMLQIITLGGALRDLTHHHARSLCVPHTHTQSRCSFHRTTLHDTRDAASSRRDAQQNTTTKTTLRRRYYYYRPLFLFFEQQQ